MNSIPHMTERALLWTPDEIRCLRMCGYVKKRRVIAELNGLVETTWHNWEHGRNRPNVSHLEKLDELAQRAGWTPERCRKFCTHKYGPKSE